VILPEDMHQLAPRFAAAGLTARLVEADDPASEDDQIEIFRSGVDTRVTIQIALIGGGFYINEYQGEDASLVMIPRGNFRTLRKAIDRAIETIKAQQPTNANAAT
jgi:2-methylisocitrate lyase-like PEP mutase family enzyme